MSTLQLTILGCSASGGTPLIGCHCNVCHSTDPKNNRTRCSAYIVADSVNLVIDTGPDFRQQALRENIKQVDAVLYTHLHADHLNGLDDLRNYCYLQRSSIPLYGNTETIRHIKRCFGYALNPPSAHWDKPSLMAHVINKRPIKIKQIRCIPLPLQHGGQQILGWRIGNLAWLTDTSAIPESSWTLLKGLDVICIDCLGMQPYPSHSHFEQTCAWAKQINAKRTFLIHMAHSLEYHDTLKRCPQGIEPAFDGLQLSIPFEP